MLAFLRNLFGHRPSRFERFRTGSTSLAHRVGGRRGGIALGTLATIAAPFIIKKIRARMAQRQGASQSAAY
jgi:hypothetical protein